MLVGHLIPHQGGIWNLLLILNAWFCGTVYFENGYSDGLNSLIFALCTFQDVCFGMCYALLKSALLL